jgi:hypothetical protein
MEDPVAQGWTSAAIRLCRCFLIGVLPIESPVGIAIWPDEAGEKRR